MLEPSSVICNQEGELDLYWSATEVVQHPFEMAITSGWHFSLHWRVWGTRRYELLNGTFESEGVGKNPPNGTNDPSKLSGFHNHIAIKSMGTGIWVKILGKREYRWLVQNTCMFLKSKPEHGPNKFLSPLSVVTLVIFSWLSMHGGVRVRKQTVKRWLKRYFTILDSKLHARIGLSWGWS